MTPTKAQKITAAAVSGVALAAMFTAGTVTGRATAPTIGYSPASAYGIPPATAPSASTAPSNPYGIPTEATPTPSAPPAAPSLYGHQGLAAEIAQDLGHDSMSAACEAGIEWTCDITDAKTSGVTQAREIVIGREPSDGDTIAQEFLALAPKSVYAVRLLYVPHGQASSSPTIVGKASR